MAKKGGSKEGISRDPYLSIPGEQKMTSESSKQKIAKIHDMFPSAMKDNLAKILQYYDDDENKVVDAITRDGGREALSNWSESGNSKSKNNKNKKKKKKGRKEPGLGSATASFDADDSSSLHSSGNVDAEVEKECPIAENRNGILDDTLDESKCLPLERINVLDTDVNYTNLKDCESKEVCAEQEIDFPSVPEDSKCLGAEAEVPVCVSPISDTSDRQDDSGYKREKYRSVKDEAHGKHLRQRTNSFRRSKTTSFSEESTSYQHNPQATSVHTKRGYEKCKKDLNRQTISLQRIHYQVDKALEESSKKLKSVFNDLKKMLDSRQEQIEHELSKTKEDALNLLKSRQDLSVELKRRVDRTPSLTESEWSELRSDVKQFVTERKYDDELGKTIWFQWSLDSITESIQTFGEVHPVKNVYSQRSHSALSNIVTQNPEPSPSSSLANEEIGSITDKNDVANMLDTVEDEAPAVKKDVMAPVARSQPIENRARVFSNTKFLNNRGGNRGGYRGNNRGFGYPPRSNNRNNYRNNYYEYSDYRNHNYQDRDVRIHDNHTGYSNNRNMNNHRNNRSDRRGQSMDFRSNNSRYRGNMGQQRHNENVVKTEPVSNETSAVDCEKPNVVNGFVNN